MKATEYHAFGSVFHRKADHSNDSAISSIFPANKNPAVGDGDLDVPPGLWAQFALVTYNQSL